MGTRARVPGPDVVVVGSINVDLVATVERHPDPGETVSGTDFRVVAGGKGANQAVAVARQGVTVAMVGCVGDDVFAPITTAALTAAGVELSHVIERPTAATGTALITVDATGENRIVVVPGANGHLAPRDIDRAADDVGNAKVVLAQLEVPVAAVQAAFELADATGATTVLNAAPVDTIDDGLLTLVDVLVVNESEASRLWGHTVSDRDAALAAGSALRQRGVGEVVVTLGARGAVWVAVDGVEYVPALEVDVLDTVGAGDAFCGVLAAGVATRADRIATLHRAAAAGALATTVRGAIPSLPDAAAIDVLVEEGRPITP